MLCQTKFLTKVLATTPRNCCSQKFEIFFPSLSKLVLSQIIQFLYHGEVVSKCDEIYPEEILENLVEIFGFPDKIIAEALSSTKSDTLSPKVELTFTNSSKKIEKVIQVSKSDFNEVNYSNRNENAMDPRKSTEKPHSGTSNQNKNVINHQNLLETPDSDTLNQIEDAMNDQNSSELPDSGTSNQNENVTNHQSSSETPDSGTSNQNKNFMNHRNSPETPISGISNQEENAINRRNSSEKPNSGTSNQNKNALNQRNSSETPESGKKNQKLYSTSTIVKPKLLKVESDLSTNQRNTDSENPTALEKEHGSSSKRNNLENKIYVNPKKLELKKAVIVLDSIIESELMKEFGEKSKQTEESSKNKDEIPDFEEESGSKMDLEVHDVDLEKSKRENLFCECENCGVSLKSLKEWRAHKQDVHEEAKPFKCMFCSSKFNRIEHLRRG